MLSGSAVCEVAVSTKLGDGARELAMLLRLALAGRQRQPPRLGSNKIINAGSCIREEEDERKKKGEAGKGERR